MNKKLIGFVILMAGSIYPLLAQTSHIITGTVYNAGDSALSGVSIQERNRNRGTTTNENGAFRFEVSSPNAVLRFTHVDFETKEVSVSGQKNITVVLNPKDGTLEDIVVIGYGTQRRRDVTGSVGSLKIENTPLTTLPNPNVLDAVKGKIAGFDIGAVANAGGNPSINIRGQNSIRASSSPLIIVDGVIFTGSFNEINPNDVEAVDILKDASSTAIYGSRGSAGVIQITTKRGKAGKPVIDIKVTTGIQSYTNRPKMRTGEDFLQYRRDYMRLQNNKTDIPLDQLLLPKELQAYNQGNTIDWWDVVVQQAPFSDYQLNFSGGSDRFSYYVSGNYLNQEGIVYNDQFKRFTILSKLDAKITDWLKFGLNLSAASKNADGVAADLEKGIINGPYGYMYSTFEGYGHWLERYPQQSTTTFNPLWRTLTYDEDRNQNYRSSAYARVDIPWIKGLSYTFNYSLNRWEGHGAQFNDEKTFVNTLVEEELRDQSKYLASAAGFRNNSERTDWYLNHLVNFSKSIKEHFVDVTLVAERQQAHTRFMRLDGRDFSMAGTTILGVNSLELGDPTKRIINTNDYKIAQLAYLARVNYSFQNKYYLSASIRKDGYSAFAEGRKYGTFPAVSAAYTISNEEFFRNKIANYLKMRISYGEIGNPSIGQYATFPSIGSYNYLFGITPAVTTYVSNLANKKLGWESTASLNLGIDFGLLKDVLSGSVDYYISNTYDLLLNRQIPSTNGFTFVNDNIGKIANKGFELQINSNNVDRGNFKWSTGLNFWINRNKVISLYGLDSDGDGVEDDDIANSYFIGKSLGAVYDYTFDGIVQISDTAFTRIYGDKPGDIKFKDLNGDNKINPDDRSVIGYTKPNFTASISNSLKYKGFELYFLFFTIQGGGKDNWYIGSNNYALNPATLYPNVANWLNKEYWMPEHPSNTIPKPNYVNKYGYRFTADRSFVRLQDLSFSYTFGDEILRRTPVKALKAYISGKNLLTFSKWEGLDPETGTGYAGVNNFPVFKIITFGLSITL